MDEQQQSPQVGQVSEVKRDWKHHLTTATPLSKALAMLMFIALPFVGFWLGLQYSTQKRNHVTPLISSPYYYKETASGQGIDSEPALSVPLECTDEDYARYLDRYAYNPSPLSTDPYSFPYVTYSLREREILKYWINAVDCVPNDKGEHSFVAINTEAEKIYPYAIRNDTTFYYTQYPFVGAILYEGLSEPVLAARKDRYSSIGYVALIDPNQTSLTLESVTPSARYTLIEPGAEIDFYDQKYRVFGVTVLDDGLVVETETGIALLSLLSQNTKVLVEFEPNTRAGYFYVDSMDGSTRYQTSLRKGKNSNAFEYSIYSQGITKDDAIAYPDVPPHTDTLVRIIN